MGIKVITDSTSYLSDQLKKEYDITTISLSVVFGDEVIKEEEISNDDFYRKMEAYETIPTSTQPSIEELKQLFMGFVKEGHDIVSVFISSEMSGTYSTAHMVKNTVLEDYPEARIEVIDSRSNCMQLGFVALAAAKAAKANKTFKETIDVAKSTIRRSRFLFSPETLDYLRKGGRIGSAKALLGSFLQLKPILTVEDGKTDSLTTVRTRKKSINKIIEIFKEDIEKLGLINIVVHHINCEEQAKKLAEAIKIQTGKIADILAIGPVVGVHVGPGAMGIVYCTEKFMR